MKAQERDEGGILVITLRQPRLDASSAVEFGALLARAIGDRQTRILVDMQEIQFIDSSGLGAMASVRKKMGDRGRLAFCAQSQQARRMLALTRMDRVLELHDTAEQAIAALK